MLFQIAWKPLYMHVWYVVSFILQTGLPHIHIHLSVQSLHINCECCFLSFTKIAQLRKNIMNLLCFIFVDTGYSVKMYFNI